MTDLALLDAQSQEVGSGLVELFEIMIHPTDEDTGHAFYIHNGLDYDTAIGGSSYNVCFPSIDGLTLNEYISIPVEISGISVSSAGPSARPTLRIANIPVLSRTIAATGDGIDDEQTLFDYLVSRGLTSAKSFLGATVRYRTTLEKYIYRPGDPPDTPIEFPTSTFIIDRISAEDNITVEFELASPADLERATIPARLISSKYCAWEYQGMAYGRGGCSWPLTSKDLWVDKDDNIIATDSGTVSTWNASATYTQGDLVKVYLNPGWGMYEAVINVPVGISPTAGTVYWRRKDMCGKRLNSCKIRFQGNSSLTNPVDFDNDLDTSHSLPFGGYLGSKTTL